jgi:hypothetical protein
MYNTGFSSMLSYLGPPTGSTLPVSTAAGLVDSVLAGTGSNTSSKSGYSFIYSPGSVVNSRVDVYGINANPTTVGTTGTNFYFTDVTGVIRQNSTATASATDSPLAG